MESAADALRSIDVTTAAWRLTLETANGKRIPPEAARCVLIAAGADPGAAASLASHALLETPTGEQRPSRLIPEQSVKYQTERGAW